MKFTFSKQEKIDILENTLSWIVVFMMCLYGFGKIVQFNGAIQVEKTLPELTGMELMWAFYGYSFPFVLIIGFLEVLGAALIFLKRTRVLGCILTSTILLNIILQDIFFEVHPGALTTAIILQLFVLIILWMDKTRIVTALKIILTHNRTKHSLNKRIVAFIITLIAFIVLCFLQNYLISIISQFL